MDGLEGYGHPGSIAGLRRVGSEVMPSRIQRRRTKGWIMPSGAIYVGRIGGLGSSPWRNPFKIGGYFRLGDSDPGARFRMEWMQTYSDPPERGFTRIVDNQMAVDWFRLLAANWSPEMLARCRRDLGGHDLVCWCPLVDAAGKPVPCHADLLLAIANGPREAVEMPLRGTPDRA